MRFAYLVSIAIVLNTVPARAEDFMKYMKPYEESPQDAEALRLVSAVDQAIGNNDKVAYDLALLKLRAANPKKQLGSCLRAQDGTKRALAIMGHRLLPIKRAFEDLRFMLMDSNPMVRWQVMLYAADLPQGIDVDMLKMSLSDTHPEVRSAAIVAVAKVARRKEEAAELFRMRLKEETDPNVIKKLKVGFTLLGMPSPGAQ
jgi:HEAT repeat protein